MSTAVNNRTAGPNNHPYNDMVALFVNMTLKGWLWYHGENNLFEHAGAVQLLSIFSGNARNFPFRCFNYDDFSEKELNRHDMPPTLPSVC